MRILDTNQNSTPESACSVTIEQKIRMTYSRAHAPLPVVIGSGFRSCQGDIGGKQSGVELVQAKNKFKRTR